MMACERVQVFHRLCGHCSISLMHTEECKSGKRQTQDTEGRSNWHNHFSTPGISIPTERLNPCHLCWNPIPASFRLHYINAKCLYCNPDPTLGDPATQIIQGESPLYYQNGIRLPREQIDELAAEARRLVEKDTSLINPTSPEKRLVRKEVWEVLYNKYRQTLEGRGPNARILCDFQDNGKDFLQAVGPPFSDVCSICKEDAVNDRDTGEGVGNPRKLPCGHIYHYECIVEWITLLGYGNCPVCRKEWELIFKNGYEDPVFRWYPAQKRVVMVDGHIPFGLSGNIGGGNFNPVLDPNRWGDDNEEADYL